jgi:hypothetical protein
MGLITHPKIYQVLRLEEKHADVIKISELWSSPMTPIFFF